MSKIRISDTAPMVRIYPDETVEVCEEFQVEYNGMQWTVPKGYVCDGSSIPRFFWRVCGAPTTGPNLLPGIIHDHLYGTGLLPRDIADKCFHDALLKLEKPKLIAWAMWKAVRLCGKSHYSD